MKTYHIIGAVPDGFDKRTHKVTLPPIPGDEHHPLGREAVAIKLSSHEARFFGRHGIQLIVP